MSTREERIRWYCLREYVTVLAEKLVDAEDELEMWKEKALRRDAEGSRE